MIIELFGLPGSGKTSLAEALQAKGAVLVHMPSRARVIFDAGLFWLLHPFLASRLLISIMRRAPHGMRYALFMNGFVGYAARYRRARALSRAGTVAVLDQGFSQLFISLDKLPITFSRLFPRPDLLVAVMADVSVREERMASRGRAPREEFGYESRQAWQQNAEASFYEVLPVLEKFLRVHRYDGSQNPGAGASTLMTISAKEPRPSAPTSSLRNAAKIALAILAFLIARLARIFHRAPQVVVLMYHAIDRSGWKLAVSPEVFERQIKYIARKNWAVSLTDIVSYARGEKKLPARAVAVTFDDGYRDLLTTVLPILERHHIPATVFVPSDLSVQTDPDDKARLTEEELRLLAQSPLITIGSHAQTHRKFTELSTEEVDREARESVGTLARISGVRPRFFAYPFGARSFDAERAVRDAGYGAAFGISEGTIHQGDDVFRLKRVQVDNTMNFLLFRLRLTSAVDWNRRLADTVRRNRSVRFLRKVIRGDDPIMVRQSKDAWERQFADGKWDRLREEQPNTAKLARLVLNYAKSKNESIRVLDVGCGNGGLARIIAGDAAIEYTGVDIAPSAIVSAQEVAPSGTFIVDDAANPHQNLGLFNALVFNEVFYYLDPRTTLPRYRAHAARGARIYISVTRSWRTLFIFRRIRRHLCIDTRFRVSDRSHRWDIAFGHFL